MRINSIQTVFFLENKAPYSCNKIKDIIYSRKYKLFYFLKYSIFRETLKI